MKKETLQGLLIMSVIAFIFSHIWIYLYNQSNLAEEKARAFEIGMEAVDPMKKPIKLSNEHDLVYRQKSNAVHTLRMLWMTNAKVFTPTMDSLMQATFRGDVLDQEYYMRKIGEDKDLMIKREYLLPKYR